MAVVREFELVVGEGKLNPTEVCARVKVFQSSDRAPILQIDTHGSPDRKFPEKVSQTLQFDRDAAKQLFDILRQTYGFK